MKSCERRRIDEMWFRKGYLLCEIIKGSLMTALFNAGSIIIKGDLRKNVLTNMKRKYII